MNNKMVRSVREPLKKPRPLKTAIVADMVKVTDPKDAIIQKSRDEIIDDLEILNVSISNGSYDAVTAMDISRMCAILKKRGEELDSFHKDAVDRYFCTIRNACREERLDVVSRVKLLEVIENRAIGWKRHENLDNYFNQKITELEQKGANVFNSGTISPIIPYHPVQNQNLSSVPLAAGEILRPSGKFERPTKIAGRNYFKDEILIRNSDSGKVAPGVRDRLVQITGPHEEAISHAKLLVEDTIRRNASPVRDSSDLSNFKGNKEQREFSPFSPTLDNHVHLKKQQLQHSFSMSDASLKEYSLQVGNDVLTLSGTNAALLKTARMVLNNYFAGQCELEKHVKVSRQPSPDSNFQRFGLKRQSSLKSSGDSYASWPNNNTSRDSASPFSSSDDDFIRDESGRRISRDLSDTYKSHAEVPNNTFVDASDVQKPLIKSRSFSLPSEMVQISKSFSRMESLPNDDVFSALLSPTDIEVPSIPPPSYTYSRDFLLNCARSPHSHKQPANYAHIHQNFGEIICRSPVMFDPAKYEELRSQSTSRFQNAQTFESK